MIDPTSLAWFNPIAEVYEPVALPNQLCTKCHVNSQGDSATGGVTHDRPRRQRAPQLGRNHRRAPPDLCSDCHDPHTQQPTACIDCHGEVAELPTHIKGMNAIHPTRCSASPATTPLALR